MTNQHGPTLSADPTRRLLSAALALLLCAALAPAAAQTRRGAARARRPATAQGNIPARPADLKFKPLSYTPPRRDSYRHVLSNGVVVYAVEDHQLPLVNLSVLVRTGAYLEPAGKEGLASLAGSQMRAGGTTTQTAEQFDEAADFLAAQLSSSVGETQGGASLNLLAKDLDRGLALFFDMLRNPRFQEDRLKLAKSQIMQALERRNDRTDVIEDREWTRLIRGPEHFTAKDSTKASVEAISREDLAAFHKKYYHPANFIFAASGDFDTRQLLAKLEAATKDWRSTRDLVPPPPAPDFTPAPGVYAVHKADVNQGRVTIGHLGTTRDNPDAVAISIMNGILGGGGFTSRITSRVRSDEGLAYSAGSAFGHGVYYPGVFEASFQSKSGTTAQAIDIVLEEINRIRTTRVSAGELETEKNYAIEVFPRSFATAAQIAGTFAQDEYTKRPADYWDKYRDRVRAVTAEEVQRVAQKYLAPDKLVILVVGNIDDITKGNPDRPQHSLVRIAGGNVRRIPLPDPLTLVYPPTP